MNSKRSLSILVASLLVLMFTIVIMPSKVLAETSGTTVVLQVNSTNAVVNGKSITLDVAPYIDENSGRTLVPLRFISESLGYIVHWDHVNRSATIYNKIAINTIEESKDSVKYFRSRNTFKVVELTLGSNIAVISDEYIIEEQIMYVKNVSLDQAPVIKDGRTMLPVRFISEQMGLNVEWDGHTQKIKISSSGDGYIPEPIEAALKKVAVPYGEVVQDDREDLKSQPSEKYIVDIRSEVFGYFIDLFVKMTYNSSYMYVQVLHGKVIGLKDDTAYFSYKLTDQGENTYYDGTVKLTEEGFIISYTDEKGEKYSATFPIE